MFVIRERLYAHPVVAEGTVPVSVLWIHLARLNIAEPTVF